MKKILKSFLSLFLFILLSFLTLPFFSDSAYALPSNFTKTKIAQGFNMPTDFAFLPDSRIFVLEKGGVVKVIKNGSVLADPFINLNVDNIGERGLLGIALDPEFNSNKYIYLYYVNSSPLEIRVSRFTESNDKAVPGSEVILLKSTQALNSNHHSGTLRFGGDGKLWISIGNNSISGNPQDLSNIHGKILRINKDGSIPADNPFGSAIWAFGLRNPFRFNFLPDGRPILGDVGEAAWEEINIGVKGGNYGFPAVEGPCQGCSYINPVYAYPHNNASASVTGGFVSGNSYYFGDYALGFIKKLTFDSGFTSVIKEESFDTSAGTVVEMLPGSDGSFYYLTIFPGEIYKVSPTTGNQPPVAKISADKTYGDAPLKVNFSSNGSSDPEGQSLSYKWDFGDNQYSAQQNPSHTYNNNGKYTAKLVVNDGLVDSAEEKIDISVGNTPPQSSINSPVENFKYNAGDIINFSGSASDKEDGNVPGANYSWEVIFYHGEHIHPYLNKDGVTSGSFQISDNNDVSADTWYEVKLTVVDSGGLKTTVSRRIDPNKVKVTIASNPQGLTFNLDGAPHTTPFIFEGVVGFKRNLSIQTPQTLNGENFSFESWSDNGAISHTISTPLIDSTISAQFKSAGSGVGNLRFRIQEWDQENKWSEKFINDAVVKLTDISGNTVYQTKTSQIIDGADGWVRFDNIPSGIYGIMAYKPGFKGLWKQIDCGKKGGTFTNATVTNANTQGMKAAFDNEAPVEVGKTTVCQDLGLKPITKGRLAFRVTKVIKDAQGNYSPVGYVNGATVKLTDTTGNNVIATQTSAKSDAGEDGWVRFENVQVGKYGILAYKTGLEGEAKMVNCLYVSQKSSINNSSTEGLNAAWNSDVLIEGGKTTVCVNLGFLESAQKTGAVRFRVQEWNKDSTWSGKFINQAKAKLTDISGQTVIATSSSSIKDGMDGWVWFDNIPVGNYGIMAFKDSFAGVWKQVDCTRLGGSFENATIQNNNTEGKVAAFDNSVQITENGVTVCKDLGLKNVVQRGSLRFRIQEWANNAWTGKFLNDIIVKLTDTSGNTVIATGSSANKNNEDGWVWFDDIPVGLYGIMAYKNGFEGVWKQVDCNDPDGSLIDSTINNSNTEGHIAAWDNNASIESGKVTVCQDLGLKIVVSGQITTQNIQIKESTDSAKTVQPEEPKESTESATANIETPSYTATTSANMQ